VRWQPFPWPRRAERKRRIEQARAGARASRHQADRAARIERDLRRIVEENHFAAAIAEQIIRRHTQGNGGTS
jgi:hypothetical protein